MEVAYLKKKNYLSYSYPIQVFSIAVFKARRFGYMINKVLFQIY